MTAFCALISLFLGTELARAQERNKAKPSAPETNRNTVITADKLTFDYEKHYGLLENDVHVVGKDISIDADRIEIRFSADNQVTNMVATGNVSIRQADGVATCSTARCDVVRGEMILTGNPKLTGGQRLMKGDVITINREPGKKSVRVKCVGSPGNPTNLILGPEAKFDDIRLSDERDRR